jgi:hypothetical protein
MVMVTSSMTCGKSTAKGTACDSVAVLTLPVL